MKITTAVLTFVATAAAVLGTATPATARPGITKPLPGHCAGATVRTYVQTGSTQRTTNAWGNIALDLNANTGTSDCNGIWPGGQLFVAAAKMQRRRQILLMAPVHRPRPHGHRDRRTAEHLLQADLVRHRRQ